MKKTIILYALFFCGVLKLSAQNRADVWQLGYEFWPRKPVVTFYDDVADTLGIKRHSSFFLTNSSIGDSFGNILFYTNGQIIQNKKNDSLLNCKEFNFGYATDSLYTAGEGLGFNQATLILPQPGSKNLYYLFHETGSNYFLVKQYLPDTVLDGQPFQLRYSIVNMNLDHDLGGIVPNKKSIVAIDDTLLLGMLSACKHSNGEDWWILTHQYNSNLYYRLLLTGNGIEEMDTQKIGRIIYPEDTIDGFLADVDELGQACFAPDGNKYARTLLTNVVDIFNFDRCTGLLSNSETFRIPTDSAIASYGCAFSPDSRFLYVNSWRFLYQIDLDNPDSSSSVEIVSRYDGYRDSFSGIETDFEFSQLAPDGKIYMNTFGSTPCLHVVNDPDLKGLDCNFTQHSFILPSYNLSVPSFPNYDLGPLGNLVAEAGPNDTIGKMQSVQIGIPPVAGVKYQWKANSTLSDTSIAQPIATPDTTTTYYVTFTDTSTFSSCNVREDTVTVFVKIATSNQSQKPQAKNQNSFRVSPNPASHWLNIVYHSNDDAEFELYNSFGEKVANVSLYHYFRNRMLNVSDLADEVYNYRIVQRNETIQTGTVAVMR